MILWQRKQIQDTWLVSVKLLRASLLGGRRVEELKQRGVELIIRGPTTPSVEFAHILTIVRFWSVDNDQVGSRWGLVSFSITILKLSNIICSYLVSITNPLLKWSNIIFSSYLWSWSAAPSQFWNGQTLSVVIFEAGQFHQPTCFFQMRNLTRMQPLQLNCEHWRNEQTQLTMISW